MVVAFMLLQLVVYFTTTSTCNAFCLLHQQHASLVGGIKSSWACTNNVPINERRMSIDDDDDNDDHTQKSVKENRRAFLKTATGSLISSFVVVMSSSAQSASAGIDVSALQVEGSGGGNSILKEQLKTIDGSAIARINQIKESTPPRATTASNNLVRVAEEEIDPTITTWLYRSNPGTSPRLSRAGTLRNLFRCDDQAVGPTGSGSVGITFEFPSDWLQLDKFLGGISYVDQRNGDRLYVLKTKLPNGERLSTIPKSFFGTSIFDPKGTIVKSQGVEIDEYKVSSSTTINECPDNSCSTHKRYKIKYSTVTGNGLRVERRALLDAYEMSSKGDIYMMMTSSNAVKFEKKDSPERQTVEAIVDSFEINV